MNHYEREEKLRQIVSGFFHFKFKNIIYKYFEPTNSLFSEVSFYTKTLDEELKKDGFLTGDEEKQFLIKRGLWSEEKEKEFDTCKNDIETLRKEKGKLQYQSNKLKAVEMTIKALDERIKELSEIRGSMYVHTVEYQKYYRTSVMLLSQCVRNSHAELIWKTMEEMEESIGVSETEQLLRITSSEANRINSKTIRDIARTEPWRTIWKTSCKTGTSLFEHAASNMTKAQYELCYWSNVYDSVYESADYPGQDVIDDDDKLDDWFIQQSDKNGSSTKKKSNQISSSSKINNASEVFIAVDTPEDAQKVYEELNSSGAKSVISKRSIAIDKHGELSEDQLPDVSEGIRMEINKMGLKKQ